MLDRVKIYSFKTLSHIILGIDQLKFQQINNLNNISEKNIFLLFTVLKHYTLT